MFGQKKREAKKAAAAETRKAILASIRQKREEVEQCNDAGEKILKLASISGEIGERIASINNQALDKARRASNSVVLGGLVGTLGTVTAVIALTSGAVMAAPIAILVVGGGVTIIGSTKAGNAAEKKMTEIDFLKELNEQYSVVNTRFSEVIALEIEGIAYSKHYDKVVEKLPNLQGQLTSIFRRTAAKPALNPPKKAGRFNL